MRAGKQYTVAFDGFLLPRPGGAAADAAQGRADVRLIARLAGLGLLPCTLIYPQIALPTLRGKGVHREIS